MCIRDRYNTVCNKYASTLAFKVLVISIMLKKKGLTDNMYPSSKQQKYKHTKFGSHRIMNYIPYLVSY